MPNGPAHYNLTRIALLGTIPVFYLGGITEGLYFSGGILATLYLDPDLDIRHRLGGVGNAIGLDAYQKLIPHRAGLYEKNWRNFGKRDWWKLFFFSHIPFLGTLPRTLIVVVPALAVFLMFSILQHFPWYGLMWVYLGMGYSDTWHVVADIIVSDYKRGRKWKQDSHSQAKAAKKSKTDI